MKAMRTRMKHRTRPSFQCLVILAILLVLAVTVCVLPVAAADGVMAINEPETETSSTTSLRPTWSSSKQVSVVSHGLRVLAAQDELVFTGLCGNEISFTAEDIERAMNMSELNYITVTRLPDPSLGTLFVGSTGAAVGQTVSAANLSFLSYAAADDSRPSEATVGFSVNGWGYEMTCRLCLTDKLNYTPTTSLAPKLALSVMTYCDLPMSGTLSAYDPEGDELTFEIVRYASSGRVTLTDKHTGAYVYTPDSSFTGKDEFQYVVRDRYGNYSTAATVTISVDAKPASVQYVDISDSVYASSVIRIASNGIMNGTQVGNSCYFKPNENISRVEFLVTAMNVAGINEEVLDAAGIKSNAPTGFDDNDEIPESMRGYVKLASTRGYIQGKNVDGKLVFAPHESITRAEAAVILSNIIGYANQTAVSAFADAQSVPTWSMQALSSLRSLGILGCPDGNAGASVVMTRGESAEWLCKTMQLIQG